MNMQVLCASWTIQFHQLLSFLSTGAFFSKQTRKQDPTFHMCLHTGHLKNHNKNQNKNMSHNPENPHEHLLLYITFCLFVIKSSLHSGGAGAWAWNLGVSGTKVFCITIILSSWFYIYIYFFMPEIMEVLHLLDFSWQIVRPIWDLEEVLCT